MGTLSLVRGDDAVGFKNKVDDLSTLPPFATDINTLVAQLTAKVGELETLVEGKVTKGELKTEIAFSDELVLIQAQEVAVIGAFTVIDILNEQNGTTSGQIDITITRIIGDKVRTGSIISNNFGASEGTKIDLDNETITMGGSASPSLFYDGAGNLTISGTLEAGSIIAGSVTIDGKAISVISTDSNTGAVHSVVVGNPHNTDTADLSGDLDDIADGSTFFKSTANQNTGGTRGFNALDSSFDYIRALSTQKIVISGSNPADGIIIDSTGLRGFTSSSLTVEISTSGNSTWSGNITTSGQVKATGVDLGGANASIVAIPDTNSVIGIAAIKDINGTATGIDSVHAGNNQNAIRGITTATTGGTGVLGDCTTAGSFALEAFNSNASGTALLLSSDIITGDADFEDNVNIQGTLDVAGVTTLTANMTTNSHLSLTGTTKNLQIGGATITGNACLNMKKGVSPSRLTDQISMFGLDASVSAKTTLAFVLDEGVAAIGTFTPSHKLRIWINATEYDIQLDAV